MRNETGVPNSIDDCLDDGKMAQSHRDHQTARILLADFRKRFSLSPSDDGAPVPAWSEECDNLAIQYIQDVILSIDWYTRNLEHARKWKLLCTVAYALLLVAIPVALLNVNKLLATSSGLDYPVIAQIMVGLSAIAGMTQLGNATMSAYARFSIWCNTRARLKTIWYALLSHWQGTNILRSSDDLAAFVKELRTGIEQARALLETEQQDYYDKLSTAFPDLLETLAKAAASARAVITGYAPLAANAADGLQAAVKARDEYTRALDTRNSVLALVDKFQKSAPAAGTPEHIAWQAQLATWQSYLNDAEKNLIVAKATVAASARS